MNYIKQLFITNMNAAVYVTTEPRTDGFGAQFQNIIFDILFTYSNTNYRYVFPNINSFEHNYTRDSGFTERLIRYMNLRDYFPNKAFNSVKYYKSTSTYTYVENNLTQLLKSQTMNTIKTHFYADKNTYFDTHYHNVAVHVRRLNSDDSRVDGTETPDSYYIGLMKTIRDTHPVNGKPLMFHIYSQTRGAGYNERFMKLYNPGDDDRIKFYLNGNLLHTFHGMVFADILVCSRSSFSYCAALLTNGVVYYKPFWHKPADFWSVA